MSSRAWLACAAVICGLVLARCGEDGPTGRDGGAADGATTPKKDGVTLDAPACDDPQTYYPDVDQDGWGSAGAPGVEACAQPAGHVTNRVDCGDEDPRAFPGQQQFFATPIEGPSGNPFDFNCDGRAEPDVAYKDTINCNGRGYTVCEGKFEPAWYGTVPPGCGETRAIVVSCTLNGGALNFTCDANLSGEATQSCR